MTDQPTTKAQTIKPTLGEHVTELFARVAKLNDKMAAVLAPEWGARMGIIPEGHPLHPGATDTSPEEQSAPADWEAIARHRERELKRVGEARHRAEEELRRYTEAESADSAAGSYAGRVEELQAAVAGLAQAIRLTREYVGADLLPAVTGWDWYDALRRWAPDALPDNAQPERWVHILFTSPDPTTANTSARAIADHLAAEFPGVGMRISSNAVEGGKGTQIVGTPCVPDFTSPLAGRIEVRDPCPWCESSPSLIPRALMDEHVATVHPEQRR